MIITQLTGGLGNQLFQYAAGLSLSLHHNAILKCDINQYKTATVRTLDLRMFNVDIIAASQEDIASLQPTGFFQKVFARLKSNYKRKVYKEPHFHFDTHFFKAGNHVYLKGNWQSELYFKKIRESLRQQFKVKETYIENVKQYGNSLKNENSVAVHIRRGDYLLPKTTAYHGVLSSNYYKSAVDKIAEKLNDPVFYIFSDDPEWAERELQIERPLNFVSNTVTTSAIEDFYLMQSCRHNIIANSSFSWWAAWLNNNRGKIVIAPAKWFNEGPKDTYDLFPKDWIKL